MTLAQILDWAAHPDHRYPQLVLSRKPDRILPAGKQSWDSFLLYANDEMWALLVTRIEQWDERSGVQGVVERDRKEIA